MSKKLRLTESQYDKLMQFIVETRFDKVLQNSIKVGDVIRIEFKSSTSNFKVIDSTNGQIQMDNIDSGSTNINFRYYMSVTSLDGNKLEVRRAHKVKDKDILTDIKKWHVIPVNDIKKIDVIRNGQVVDSVDEPKPSATQKKSVVQQPIGDETKDKLNDVLAILLSKVNKDNGLKLELTDGTSIDFCCLEKASNVLNLELDSEAVAPNLKKWDSYTLTVKGDLNKDGENFYELNKDIISTKDNGESIDLNLVGHSGDNSESVTITGIANVIPLDSCKSKAVDFDANDETSEDKDEVEKMMKAILDDPLMKKAFYSQPTLWNLLVGALKGKNPKGTGIGPARNIISQYGEAKHRKILGPNGNNFKTNKQAKFEVLEDVIISPTGSPRDTLRLNSGSIYDALVNEYKLGDDNLTLTNKTLGFKILMKKSVADKPDTFEVTIVKVIKGKNTGEIREFPKSAIIRFKNERGSGYSKGEVKKNK